MASQNSCARVPLIGALSISLSVIAAAPALSAEAACPQTDTGIVVPKGFCATVFADKVGHARQMAVAPNGTVFVNTWSGVYYNNDTPPEGGFVVLELNAAADFDDAYVDYGKDVDAEVATALGLSVPQLLPAG